MRRMIAALMVAAGVLWATAEMAGETPALGSWNFTSGSVKDGTVKDLAGGPAAKINGDMPLVSVGKTQALQFTNTSSVTMSPDFRKAKFPQGDFSTEAWVRVDAAKRWGRIVGIFSREGGQLRGWFLGFHDNRFILSLRTQNPAPGGPKPVTTQLHAGAPYHPGNWYHVAATYDGEEMRIYVNGLLAASSKDCRGEIDYPTQAAYEMGSFVDGADIDPLNALVNEVKVYDSALTPAEVAAHYGDKAELLSAAPPVLISGIFGSNMVVQRSQPLPVWGRTQPNAKVKVTCAASAAETTADKDGRWRVNLPAVKDPGPHQMTIQAAGRSLTFKNVLAGEVWFCVGQSNLALETKAIPPQQRPPMNDAQVRLFMVPREMSDSPEEFTGGWWEVGNPWSIAQFSAVGSVFGLRLRSELNVPVGLLNASWGGTPCESWMSMQSLESSPEFAPIVQRVKEKGLWQGCGHYNKMIAPIIPFAIRGVVWYQGENNFGRGYQYRTLFPALIKDWRARWGEGDFPFYYVQIAPFKYGGDEPYTQWNMATAELWEAQIRTLSLPNTGIVGTCDATFSISDNHASNKRLIGERMATLALAKTYGRKDLVYSGPKFKSFKVEGDKIRITFDSVDGGLTARDGKPLDWFRIAGEDQKFHDAKAEIDGETVVVRSADVPKPVAVRFAWSGIAQPNFANKAGLPALPFRTDDWPMVSKDNK